MKYFEEYDAQHHPEIREFLVLIFTHISGEGVLAIDKNIKKILGVYNRSNTPLKCYDITFLQKIIDLNLLAQEGSLFILDFTCKIFTQ